MNAVIAAIDWTLIVSKILALFALVFFAKQPFLKMLKDSPSKDVRDQVESSLLILVCISIIFHFFGRLAADAIINADMGVMAKRQVYYTYFSLHDLLAVVAIMRLHDIKNCQFARITRYVCYFSGVSIGLQLTRYVDRVVLEANFLEHIYSHGLVLTNALTAGLLLMYPLSRLLLISPNKRWS
ncbi:hypothetical protein [Pseudoalteromonas piscicida]|uniref:Integral membrane protein n=1 Tax=Pseudoalteromonas piscicida TaxID=43662 RepID=A0A2A5JL08_PSEO7|nr:hypothetical protein [Pseudoalteromonas piscicida]PCK30118.1 hypothetical protein CEX98_19180 [Pseudoalteromonas piscicida]